MRLQDAGMKSTEPASLCMDAERADRAMDGPLSALP